MGYSLPGGDPGVAAGLSAGVSQVPPLRAAADHAQIGSRSSSERSAMTDPQHHLAQIDVARVRRTPADPADADVVATLDAVEAAQGVVWRLVGVGGDAADICAFADPDVIITASVWTGVETQAEPTCRQPLHRDITRRHKERFERLGLFPPPGQGATRPVLDRCA